MIKMNEPKNLKDLSFEIGTEPTIAENVQNQLKQSAIAHIKYMRREGRDLYNANIDEKSAIPWIIDYFGISDEELK